ncbi:hypothetical protein B0T26DRAFT_634636 [Lasiosphaeria miniovina]|uniref:Zn(2)-C6 fungal-type domain-containing protein n=1 Tax=Lasiosphaeria miniovina TaxID=1954250 RepID=A0AA40EG97_9PEZI|nr:uncharacterized protein B0T26DRAFT_634636 [Lasiosphaeria miniovina]KAK0734238.1 hypothetical protein B0T26DRAFT_634636 [Lasiosphaeria miniovina]
MSSKPIRRRMRMITSCLECRRRKLKCDKSQPCSNCLKFNRDCHYLGPKLDEASQLRLTEIKEKVGSLERQLERDVAKTTATSRGSYQQRIVADDIDGEFDDDRDLEITPMVALDLTYEDDLDGTGATDDLIDLGIRVGRMRITERIGGLNRPRIAEEIQAGIGTPRTPRAFAAPAPGYQRDEGMFDASGGPEPVVPDFLRPGAAFIPPTSGFFFGQVVESHNFLNFLPPKKVGDILLARYYDAVHLIARCLHWPSFQGVYQSFWEDVDRYIEPRPSVQGVVFAAWFSAAVSFDEDQLSRECGLSKAHLVANLKIGTETALSKANFLRTTKVETLQAFVMYMLPLCREEVSRAHSVLVGAAVRMSECMGLHRDGEAYGLSPLETHVRRLIWHQLCFLDIRTCEAQGPKPAIRREDYDTKLPLNCDEDELTAHTMVAPTPAEHWTSTLFSLMRFEINEMMRNIWTDRRKLEMHKTTLTAVLTKIEKFRKRMFEKYDRFLNDVVPSQRYAKLVMHLLVYRLHAMVLHPYHANTTNPMPDRLNGVLVTSGIMIIEIAIQLEANTLFRDWAWYLGAYQQYQIALLLATEIYYRPNSSEAHRIWPCLDYVFGLDPNMARDDKSLQILTEIMGKSTVYMGMRKMRAPTAITKAVPDRQAVKESPPPQPQPLPLHLQQQQQQQQQQSMVMPMSMPMQGLKTEPGMPPPPSSNMAMAAASVHGMPLQAAASMQQNFVFAGVSNGEVLWGLPPGSPENSSDTGSVAGGQSQHHGSIAGQAVSVMDNIDWVCWFFSLFLLYNGQRLMTSLLCFSVSRTRCKSCSPQTQSRASSCLTTISIRALMAAGAAAGWAWPRHRRPPLNLLAHLGFRETKEDGLLLERRFGFFGRGFLFSFSSQVAGA